jgi:hypothetical protein
MKTNFLHKIKLKFAIKLKRLLNPNLADRTTKTERDVICIFNALVSNESSELLMHPNNEKFYMKSAKTGIFITLSTHYNEISIINHVYGYNVRLSNRVLHEMIKTFLLEVEKRRIAMTLEYNNNIEHSLNNIAKTIKERL